MAINRPLAQVFAFVADAETAPQWQADPIDRVFSAATGTKRRELPFSIEPPFVVMRSPGVLMGDPVHGPP